MTRPNRYILRMALFLVIIGALVAPLAPGLMNAFFFNPTLNGVVLGVFVIGAAINFRQVILLGPEVQWMDGMRRQIPLSSRAPRLLAPIARMMGDGVEEISLSAVTLRSVLDSLASRLDEQRDLARYFVGLLIFLGLLGTFWGLSHTVGSMGEVIRSLSLAGGDANSAFEHLKAGMEAPLGGMGMAFSTSLFGLAGSLIVGFLDLQAGQAQNDFFNELEEWLAGRTDLTSGMAPSNSAPVADPAPAYTHALLERTAERLDQLTQALVRSEDSRVQTSALMAEMAKRMASLSDVIKAQQHDVGRFNEASAQIQPLLSRLVDETTHGRQQITAEIQGEVRALARVLASQDELRRAQDRGSR